MKVLVVGSGGREHALVWKLAQSPSVSSIYSLPGNAGSGQLSKRIASNVMDFRVVCEFAEKEAIDLVVVGPESPLIGGLADELEQRGLRVFGPSKLGAQIEGSKVFAKCLMLEEGIPTASCEVFDDLDRACEYVKFVGTRRDAPIVVKADGEAAGKGVFVVQTTDEALLAIDLIMRKKIFGKSGDRVIIEEYLDGPEATFMCFVDGETFLPMVPSQDHKRVYDGDEGPNTGGMGCYAPVPIISEEVREEIISRIVRPTLQALAKRGIYYKGVLYVGLALTSEGPKVVEFNCRFGDPEAQVVLPLMSGDLAELCLLTAEGRLKDAMIDWSSRKAVCVVMASGGYPGNYEKGKVITGIEEAEREGAMVFHAGTEVLNAKLVTAGGRVLGVTALGNSFQEAIERTYNAVSKIHFENVHYRRDIARRALDCERRSGCPEK
ncbi:MAG: phosphoribosylamine--glycine ligase [Armatimonadota bacterium]